ncbi:MAG: hypothetical protein ACOYKM_04355 [Caulobacterales bacterium]|jgi:hypothetical protein
MVSRIIALFNLKPGVTPQAYESWAKRVDLPTVNGLRSVESFEVFRSTGLLGSDAKPPYNYVEIIDVADMDMFFGDIGSEQMQKIAAEFQAMVTDLAFINTDKL